MSDAHYPQIQYPAAQPESPSRHAKVDHHTGARFDLRLDHVAELLGTTDETVRRMMVEGLVMVHVVDGVEWASRQLLASGDAAIRAFVERSQPE